MRFSIAVLAVLVVGCQVTIADETSKSDGGSCASCGAGDCVDLRSDRDHCGSCSQACGTGEACVGGVCTAPACGPGAVECPTGSGAFDRACVHVASSMDHCGACEAECTSSRISGIPVCAAGDCRVAQQGEPLFAAGEDALGGTVRVYDFTAGLGSQSLCFSGFDSLGGGIVCGFFGLVYASHEAVAQSSAQGIGELSCDGSETVVTDCSYVVGACATDEIVRLTCALP